MQPTGLPRPPFGLQPSVGSWLMPRFDEDSSWLGHVAAQKAKSMPEEPAWEADFDAFLAETACVADDKPSAVASSAPPVDQVRARSNSGLLLLAPPPPPTSRCSVKMAVSAVADPVVIERLVDEKKPKPKEEKPTKAARVRPLSTTEELIGTNRALDDDEEGLLGDDPAGPVEAVFRRPLGDGVDSASESDGERGRAYVARKPPAPVEPRQPPSMAEGDAGAQAARLAAEEEETPAKWEALNAEAPKVSSTSEPAARPAKAASPAKAAAAAPKAVAQADTVDSSKPLRDGTPVAPQASKQAPLPSTSAAAAPKAAQQPPGAVGSRQAAWGNDVDSQVAKRLDNFFGDRNSWERVSSECQGSGTSRPSAEAASARPSNRFKVRVPAPHPGLQYRRSKQLGDRYQRYAENGSTVTGEVEDGGAWLKLSHNVFLPMRIEGNQVLEPLPRGLAADTPQAAPAAGSGSAGAEQLSWIWGWCTGCRDGPMVDSDILVRGDPPRTASAPNDLPSSYTSR